MIIFLQAKPVLYNKGYSYEFSIIGIIMGFIACSIPILNVIMILSIVFNSDKIIDGVVERIVKNYEQ